MDEKERIQRVSHFEEIYDRGKSAVAELIAAAEAYLAVEAELRELEGYYISPQWLGDVDADRKGFLPPDMKRGILSEDAICDLLTDEHRIKKLYSLCRQIPNDAVS